MKNIEINRQQPYYRFFELLPGIITWGIFAASVVLSFIKPEFFAVLIIIFSTYWLLKAFVMSARLIASYKIYKKDIHINWKERCQKKFGSNNLTKNWQDVYHVVITACYKESFETLDYSLEAIRKSDYPLDKIIFVLATEERAKEIGQDNANKLQKKYGNLFYKFIHSQHPVNLPDEIAGKGANITYAAKKALKFIENKKIPIENVMVTTFDADHRPHKHYFSAMTYAYLDTKDPIYKSYQPLPMFFNNIWDVPIIIRSISIGSSFWQMIESTRPYRLRNFASHAQPLKALIETNFWSRLTIVEDGHQFWRSYFAFDGKYSVVPVNIPVYQDAVLSNKGYYQTFREQYLQKKRWACGASDVAYVAINSIKDKKIPFWDKFFQNIRLMDGHISWSTTSIVLFFAGWLPIILNSAFSETVVAFNFPFIYSRILTIAMFGMAVTLTISTLMLPPRPKRSLNLSILLEWIITPFLLPITNIVFSSLPAIHAQTLLLQGKYLGFHVTEKKAVKYQNMKNKTECK